MILSRISNTSWPRSWRCRQRTIVWCIINCYWQENVTRDVVYLRYFSNYFKSFHPRRLRTRCVCVCVRWTNENFLFQLARVDLFAGINIVYTRNLFLFSYKTSTVVPIMRAQLQDYGRGRAAERCKIYARDLLRHLFYTRLYVETRGV